MSIRWVSGFGSTTFHMGLPHISAELTELTVVITLAESEVWSDEAFNVR